MNVPKKNGFTIRSWADIAAITAILIFCVAALSWGLKIEGEVNSVRDVVMANSRQIGNGILPRAEERIRSLEKEVNDLKAEMKRMEARMATHGVNGSRH